jgi:hypothetical protein
MPGLKIKKRWLPDENAESIDAMRIRNCQTMLTVMLKVVFIYAIVKNIFKTGV